MKNTFYVLKSRASNQFYRRGAFAPLATDAARFASVTAALQHLQGQRWMTDPYDLVRVEETPGVEQRVVLGETEEAPKGAVVKYALNTLSGFAVNLASGDYGARWSTDIDKAQLFMSAGCLLRHVQKDCLGEDSDSVNGSAKIVRITIVAGTPTVTETVLA